MMPSPVRHKPSQGFSLVELAISLVVIAIVLAIGLTSLRTFNRQSEIRTTRERLEEAEKAIIAFAQVNRRLPCPDITPDADADNVGNDGLEDACSNRRGGVPWNTLGLRDATDGWGRPLHYLATPAFQQNSFKLSDSGDIALFDGSTNTNTVGAVAFALWSEGPDRTNTSGAETGNRVLVGSGTNPSDDILTWTSRFIFVGRILDAGHILPP